MPVIPVSGSIQDAQPGPRTSTLIGYDIIGYDIIRGLLGVKLVRN